MDLYDGLPVCLLLAASFVAVGGGEALRLSLKKNPKVFLADCHGEFWWRSYEALGGS